MKVIINESQFEGLINEIGDVSAGPYDWEMESDLEYKFDTENDRYSVQFMNMENMGEAMNHYIVEEGEIDPSKMWSVFYTAESIDYTHQSKTTDKANIYRVISTVMDILKDFMDNNEVSLIGISTIQPDEVEDDETTRTKLYKAMIRKHIPSGWVMKEIDPNRFAVYNREEATGSEEGPI